MAINKHEIAIQLAKTVEDWSHDPNDKITTGVYVVIGETTYIDVISDTFGEVILVAVNDDGSAREVLSAEIREIEKNR